MVTSVAPRNPAKPFRPPSTAAVINRDTIVSTVIFCENTSLASLILFCPNIRATIVDVPTAKVSDNANMPVTKGDEMLTAASAVSDTPLATNMPSTMVYNANTHWDATAGRINLKKSRFKDFPSNFITLPSPKSFMKIIPFSS